MFLSFKKICVFLVLYSHDVLAGSRGRGKPKLVICHYESGNPEKITMTQNSWDSAHIAHENDYILTDPDDDCDLIGGGGGDGGTGGGDNDNGNGDSGTDGGNGTDGGSGSGTDGGSGTGTGGGTGGSTGGGGEPETTLVICHYPPGNPANPQKVTVSESLWESGESDHNDHGDDYVLTNPTDDCIPKRRLLVEDVGVGQRVLTVISDMVNSGSMALSADSSSLHDGPKHKNLRQ